MRDLEMQSPEPTTVAGAAIPGTRLRSATSPVEIAAVAPAPAVPAEVVRARIVPLGARFANPVVVVDPRPEWLPLVRSLRGHGAPLALLSARRLEPAMYARGVRRHRMPALAGRPERWEALLLELVARLEPRPLLLGCSAPALDFLRRTRPRLGPHYTYGNLPPLGAARDADDLVDPDLALRRAVQRGEPALEVQMTRDASGRRTGLCVLAWAPGAVPDVVVTSVAGVEVASRSEAWLQAREIAGYARLVWAPDRFGRLALLAYSPLPGPGLELALADGVDFPALAYAAAVDQAVPAQQARLELVRRLPVQEPGRAGDASPLIEFRARPTWQDPLPWMASLLRSLVRT